MVLASAIVAGCYPSMTIGPDSLPNGTVGQPYSATITVASTDEVWLIEAPIGLPPGLSISHERRDLTALIAGTPTTSGSYTFTVHAYGPQFNFGGSKGERSYTVVIN